jgi:hypothetical protein
MPRFTITIIGIIECPRMYRIIYYIQPIPGQYGTVSNVFWMYWLEQEATIE